MPRSALWIRSGSLADGDLERALVARGFPLLQVDQPTAVDEGMILDAGVVLLEMGWLKQWNEFRKRFRLDHRLSIPLVVFSPDSQVETHLAALRQGADAFFSVPLDAAAVINKLEVLSTWEETAASPKVLVVDDDQVQALSAAHILSKAGIAVRTATESRKVLDTLHDYRPDLILMDLYMPDVSGVELTALIRSHREFTEIPIVYLSAELDLDKQMAALNMGGEDFLTKPISPRYLIARVRNRVARARQLREGAAQAQISGDPAWLRRQSMELIDQIQSRPVPGRQIIGILYLEIDSPILLLELFNLVGIDEVMAGLSSRIHSLAAPTDHVARFGDFCFLIIAQRAHPEALTLFARDIKSCIDTNRYWVQGESIGVTVSIGVRVLDAHQDKALFLIRDAMKACHRARVDRRGIRVCHIRQDEESSFAPGDDEILDRIEDPDNLQLLFQPIVGLQGNDTHLYQCLLRLRTADGVLLPAGEFLPAVEQTSKIYRLDRWVIIKILTMLKKSLRRGTSSGLRLIVSQSVASLNDKRRIPWIQECLDKLDLPGKGLVLEFRLPDIAKDRQGAVRYLRDLRDLGVGISVNIAGDLDTVLPILQEFPALYVKVTENQIRSKSAAWEQLVTVAHRASMQIIVSQIEQAASLATLAAKGADLIQGDFIQRPAPEMNYDFTESELI